MKLSDIYMDFLFYKITRLGLFYIAMEDGLGVKGRSVDENLYWETDY